MHYILVDGRPVAEPDILKWAQWFESADRHLAKDTFGEGDARVTVSTVFLGTDHNYGGGPPVLWETMTFGGPLDGEQERYHTAGEAARGHVAMLRRARVAMGLRPDA